MWVGLEDKSPLLDRVLQLVHEAQGEARLRDTFQLHQITHRLRQGYVVGVRLVAYIQVITNPLEVCRYVDGFVCDEHSAVSDADFRCHL